MRVLVVPSPLLGPALYAPFAQALTALGHESVVADVAVDDDGDLARFTDRLCEQAVGFDLLVPHSNSGRFAPAVSERVGTATVYVDALLPAIGSPDAFAAFVRSRIAADGLLPGWTDWWPRDEVVKAVPAEWLTVLEHSQPRLPPDFLLVDPPEVDGEQRAAYLAFGDTYRDEAEAAAAAGWPVRRLDGDHLHLVVDAPAVAAAVDVLAAQVLGPAP